FSSAPPSLLVILFPYLIHRVLFFFNDPSITETYTLSLHDALPILNSLSLPGYPGAASHLWRLILYTRKVNVAMSRVSPVMLDNLDRKSTRLNSSHVKISYAVFCLKKKT